MSEDTRGPLDPGMKEFYKQLVAATPAGSEAWPLERQRTAWNALCASFRAPYPATVTLRDLSCNGVACRLYVPDTPGPHGVALYGHGGGWVLGGIATHDDMCAELAAQSGVAVLLMDYRLAPEHPFPAQLEDSLKVWRWLRQDGAAHGLDADRIVAAGDSAGGQMSVALAMALHELGLPQVAGLLLIYPVLGVDMKTPSYIRNANAPCLTRDEMGFYLRSFLGPEGSAAWRDPKAAPNLAGDVSYLPPTFITVAAHDPLRDDGAIFRDRLAAAQVPVGFREEPLLAHSYMRARHHSEPAMKGFRAIAAALQQLAATAV
ncbi:MAG: alpha/beta hydrolase [Hyphomicrobiales bacterium]